VEVEARGTGVTEGARRATGVNPVQAGLGASSTGELPKVFCRVSHVNFSPLPVASFLRERVEAGPIWRRTDFLRIVYLLISVTI